VAATRSEHGDDAAIRIELIATRCHNELWNFSPMIFGHVDVEHRLVDPLVPSRALQPPRVHAEHRRMRSVYA
jgi:hypothetical protein